MTVLVLGSSGLIGRAVVRGLAPTGDVVACDLCHDDVSAPPDGVPVVTADTRRLDQVIDVIQQHDVTDIVLLSYIMGALVTPTYTDFQTAIDVNITGVTNVFEAARLTKVRRIVMASTVGVYGPQSLYGDRPVTEDDLPAPRSVYGRMKALNESIAGRYAALHGVEAVTVRPSAVLGPRSTIWPARLIAPLAIGETGVAPYLPEARDNVVAAADVADLISTLATRDELRHDTYLAAGHNITMGQLVELLLELLPDADIEYADGAGTPTYAQVFDNRRAVEEFGWQPTDLRTSLQAHIDGVRADARLTLAGQ